MSCSIGKEKPSLTCSLTRELRLEFRDVLDQLNTALLHTELLILKLSHVVGQTGGFLGLALDF